MFRRESSISHNVCYKGICQSHFPNTVSNGYLLVTKETPVTRKRKDKIKDLLEEKQIKNLKNILTEYTF